MVDHWKWATNSKLSQCLHLFWGLFLESPETFRAHFGWHNSLCIFKTKASRGTKLCRYFYFYSLYNIWKDQLYRISRSKSYEWLFGPEKFSGLSRNGPLVFIILCLKILTFSSHTIRERLHAEFNSSRSTNLGGLSYCLLEVQRPAMFGFCSIFFFFYNLAWIFQLWN